MRVEGKEASRAEAGGKRNEKSDTACTKEVSQGPHFRHAATPMHRRNKGGMRAAGKVQL